MLTMEVERHEVHEKGLIEITNTTVFGIPESFHASAYPKVLETGEVKHMYSPEDMIKVNRRTENLGKAPLGSGHDCYLKGIIVQFDLAVSEYIWRQLNRYHFIDFVSSQSKMHMLLKLDIDKHCNKYVLEDQVNFLEDLVGIYNNAETDTHGIITNCDYQTKAIKPMSMEVLDELFTLRSGERVPMTKKNLFNIIVSNTPCGFMLTARMTTNYLQLKSICNQRMGHKMEEWKHFINWCLNLPEFSRITGINLND